jgi:hypothetical protein
MAPDIGFRRTAEMPRPDQEVHGFGSAASGGFLDAAARSSAVPTPDAHADRAVPP